MPVKNYVIAGFISRPHGLKGELKVKLSSPFSFPAILLKGALMLELNGRPVPFFVERHSEAGAYYLLKLQDCNSVADAEKLSGTPVLADAKILHNQDDEDINKLKGFLLIDKNSGLIGQVEEVLELPGQYLLKSTYKQEELLIPLAADYILAIKPRKKEIHLDLPEGLLNLNA